MTDDLQKLLDQYGDLIKQHLLELANQNNGQLDLHVSDLGLVFVSTALGFAANMGSSRDNLQRVSNECLGILAEKEKPKIIC